MSKLETTSTSRNSATCTEIILRDGSQVRLIFRPEVVYNQQSPEASVRGVFVYQKKRRNETWEDAASTSLATIKRGEEFRLELKAAELLTLMRNVGPLYRLFRREGVPQGRQEYLKVGDQLADFLELNETQLREYLENNEQHAARTMERVLRWLARSPEVAARFASEELPELNALVGLANLQAVLEVWKSNRDNHDEEFWQRTFHRYAFVLSQLFAYPVIVIKGNAYVGGKRVDNRHGNLIDFLGRISSSGAAVLIEIKTPGTPLLGKEYRQDVHPPSVELTGSIAQVLKYRETLMQEFHTVTHGEKGWLSSDPRCVIISGSVEDELESDLKRQSFERFRERVIGVTIITYDELFDRVEGLVRLLQAGAGDNDRRL